MTPEYQSTTQVYVSVRNNSGSDTNDLVLGSNFAQQAVASYMEVTTSAIVLERVIEELGLDESVQRLSSRTEVSSPTGTVLMDISVSGHDPEGTAEVANAIGVALSDVVEHEIEVSEGDEAGPVQIAVIQPAVVPDGPVSPRISLNAVLGLLVGLAVGLSTAILRTVLDTRFHSIEDLERALEVPILGGIAHDPKIDKRPLIVHSDRMNPRAESFRSLRTNLQFVATDDDARVFVLSSSVPNEGKTTTAANLAVALAETGASVVLVDADLRKPAVADIMGIEGGVGLTDVLIGQAELQDVLQHWGRGDFAILPAGRTPPNPSELLGSKAMQQLLESLGDTVDYVIVDTPPVLPVTDAAVVSQFATGTILVAAAESTKQQDLRGAVATLEASGVRILGVVGTMLPIKGPDSYTYGLYRYGKESNNEQYLQAPEHVISKRAKTAPWKRS